MTRFLYRMLRESGRYDPEVILLATSASDSASTLFRKPGSWRRGVSVRRESDRDFTFLHAGAWMSDLEFQRYRPRNALTNELKQYDILQFVAGSAPWVSVAADVNKPKCVWVATTTRSDRASRARVGSFPRRLWSAVMTALAGNEEVRGLQRANAVLALSPYTQRAVEVKVGAKPVTLAFCGVDTLLFRPRTAERATSGLDRGYILCVARLSDARKNVALLLRAYAWLHRSMAEIPDLWLVGEPLSRDGEKLLHQLGIASRVRSIGPQYGEDLAEVYRNALFFALSSDEEGLGIVLLEAMASGLAVVSTACGGPEVAIRDGENGFLTPVGDDAALASAMRFLIAEPELRRRFGSAGREIAEAQFALDVTGKVFLDTYERLLNMGPKASADRQRPMAELSPDV